MTESQKIIGEAGLEFFGKISASVSHEIKNTLAIINENAGLLSDYTFMLEQGRPIDPVRLRLLADKVARQIARADEIVKNMNRFAHSVDEPLATVDVSDILQFVSHLCARFAAMRQVSLDLDSAAGPVMVETNPFALQNLIGLCLEMAMDAAGSGQTVEMRVESIESGARIRLTQLQDLVKATADTFPEEQVKALLVQLNAGLDIDEAAREIIITLPAGIRRAN